MRFQLAKSCSTSLTRPELRAVTASRLQMLRKRTTCARCKKEGTVVYGHWAGDPECPYNTGKPGFDYMGLEVVATKLTGTYPCGTAAGAPSVIKRGWGGSLPCDCDPKGQFLNCNGVPQLQGSLRGRGANATMNTLAGATFTRTRACVRVCGQSRRKPRASCASACAGAGVAGRRARACV